MANIFLLGPGMWDPAKKSTSGHAPMKIRRDMAKIFEASGHKVVLMEDDPDRGGEDYIQKFDRLLRHKITDVVLYWPPLAKMQTTYDELILLCDRRGFLKRASIAIWALHHTSVAAITHDEFKVLEAGNRSRYLTAVARLGLYSLEWESDADLDEQVELLASQLRRDE
jgi:hypothetical protein